MAIFQQGENKCYFIHIPRTGGRYVSALFENSDSMICKYHRINKQRICNIDIAHLHYPLYNEYLGVENIPHISVVRNPYNKIHSSIKNMHYIHGLNYDHFLKNEDDFLEFINYELSVESSHNNWFLPQHKFISPKTFIWKYEWGFGKRFKDWVYKNTKIEINIHKINYKKFKGETEKKYSLSRKSKKNIQNYYKKDYEKFNYLRW